MFTFGWYSPQVNTKGQNYQWVVAQIKWRIIPQKKGMGGEIEIIIKNLLGACETYQWKKSNSHKIALSL